MWDPVQYVRYSDERGRPFYELLARVGATSPAYVVDLGCGPGDLTVTLAKRWPAAEVVGVDNSAEMLEAARRTLADAGLTGARGTLGAHRAHRASHGRGRREHNGSLRFQLADVREFIPPRPPDVVISNAVLQWVPGHGDLLRRLAAMLAPGGWLAIQVPGNYAQPSHQIMRDLATSPRWRAALSGVMVSRQTADPAGYLELLGGTGCEVDAWETTYLHVLQGDDPVLDWYKGSGLRPVISALPPDQADEFVRAYASRLRAAYPRRGYGTVLPFRRVFAVARRTPG